MYNILHIWREFFRPCINRWNSVQETFNKKIKKINSQCVQRRYYLRNNKKIINSWKKKKKIHNNHRIIIEEKICHVLVAASVITIMRTSTFKKK